MESYGLKDLTLSLFHSILEEEEFRAQPAIGIAMQAYLRDCEADLKSTSSPGPGRQSGRSSFAW